MEIESGMKMTPEVFQFNKEVVAPKVLQSLMRGVMKAVFELDEEPRNKVLRAMGCACFEGHEEFVGTTPTGLDFDEAFKWLNNAVPHERCFSKEGDTIVWDGYGMKETYGGCMCVLVQLGIIETRPEICICSSHHCRSALEKLTGREMEAEFVESMNTGCHNCVYKFHLKPTP